MAAVGPAGTGRRLILHMVNTNRKEKMKIFRPISSSNLDKRIHKEFKKDTDYDIFHKKDGRIVVHFWDEEYLKNNPDKDGRKK